jgi:hypothetical protein
MKPQQNKNSNRKKMTLKRFACHHTEFFNTALQRAVDRGVEWSDIMIASVERRGRPLYIAYWMEPEKKDAKT